MVRGCHCLLLGDGEAWEEVGKEGTPGRKVSGVLEADKGGQRLGKELRLGVGLD